MVRNARVHWMVVKQLIENDTAKGRRRPNGSVIVVAYITDRHARKGIAGLDIPYFYPFERLLLIRAEESI